jgi:hypothetical protein
MPIPRGCVQAFDGGGCVQISSSRASWIQQAMSPYGRWHVQRLPRVFALNPGRVPVSSLAGRVYSRLFLL